MFYAVSATMAIWRPFRRWGYGGRILNLNPRRPHGGSTSMSMGHPRLCRGLAGLLLSITEEKLYISSASSCTLPRRLHIIQSTHMAIHIVRHEEN